MTAIHARWRTLPVHLVAKLFGVLVKVEGRPYGSNRTQLAAPSRPETIAGGQVGYQFGLSAASNSPPPDRDRDALVMLLTQVITNSSATAGLGLTATAESSAVAFRAGLAAFRETREPVTGDSAATARASSMPKSMAEKIATLGPHMDKAVEIEMKSRERLRQMSP